MERETRTIKEPEQAGLIIVDDHELARAGIRSMFAREPDLEVIGEATNGREALCRDVRPDLALMDLRMPEEMDSLTATRAMKQECPATKKK